MHHTLNLLSRGGLGRAMSNRPCRASSPGARPATAAVAAAAAAGETSADNVKSDPNTESDAVQPAWLRPVLTPEGAEHIRQHKYKPGVYTPLDNLMNGTWLWLTDLLPLWLAPNLVTLLGLIPMIISYVLVWCFSPDFITPVPRFFAFFAGVALLVYQTLDAMDGKQARRTKSSSPLGQLFDHGCDCLSTLSLHSIVTMVFLPGGSRWGVIGLAATQTDFFMAQWQENYTGVLVTSFGGFGVTEAQLIIASLAFTAAALGPVRIYELFVETEFALPWLGDPLPVGLICLQAWVLFCVLMAVVAGFGVTFPVARQAGKLGESLMYLLPVSVLNVCLLLWGQDSLADDTRMITLVSGLLFFYFTTQMITFSMAKMTFPHWQPTLLPMVALTIVSNLSGTRSVLAIGLRCFAIALGILVFWWLLRVIHQLKKKLGIHAFRIATSKTL